MKTLHRRVTSLVALVLLGSSAACSDSGGGTSGGAEVEHQSALFDTETALSAASADIVEAVRLNTSDFQLDLTRDVPPAGLDAEYDELAVSAELLAREALARSYELWRASTDVSFGSASAALTSSSGGVYGRAESALEPLTTLGFAVGLAALAYGFFSGINDGVEAASQHIVDRVGVANEPELALINRELGLADAATREETQAALERLSLAELTRAKRNLEVAFQDPDDNRVRPFTLEEVNSARVQSTVKLGTTALETTVGAAQTATGGAGVSEMAGALGASATQAKLLDIAYTLDGIETDPEVESNVTLMSSAPRFELVPQPSATMDADEALRTLRDPSAGNDAVEDAAATLAREIATDPSLESTQDELGNLVIERPALVHSVRIESQPEQALEVPELDESIIAITPLGLITQVTTLEETTTRVVYELPADDPPSQPDAGSPDAGSPDLPTGGDVPQVCEDAFACARVAEPERAADWEDSMRLCFTAIGVDPAACTEGCTEALASWREDGECP